MSAATFATSGPLMLARQPTGQYPPSSALVLTSVSSRCYNGTASLGCPTITILQCAWARAHKHARIAHTLARLSLLLLPKPEPTVAAPDAQGVELVEGDGIAQLSACAPVGKWCKLDKLFPLFLIDEKYIFQLLQYKTQKLKYVHCQVSSSWLWLWAGNVAERSLGVLCWVGMAGLGMLGQGGGESASGGVLRTVSGWGGGWWWLGLVCHVEAGRRGCGSRMLHALLGRCGGGLVVGVLGMVLGGGGGVSRAMSGRHAGAGPSGDDSRGWQGPATFRGRRGGLAVVACCEP
ncbi:hypothetical protein EDB85DRAFT_1897208 [Lactarius pseudohatsudake]|nr:hypothetical protein EDB85DRAFT_1897208 [Lactarius pseudohatsudake]